MASKRRSPPAASRCSTRSRVELLLSVDDHGLAGQRREIDAVRHAVEPAGRCPRGRARRDPSARRRRRRGSAARHRAPARRREREPGSTRGSAARARPTRCPRAPGAARASARPGPAPTMATCVRSETTATRSDGEEVVLPGPCSRMSKRRSPSSGTATRVARSAVGEQAEHRVGRVRLRLVGEVDAGSRAGSAARGRTRRRRGAAPAGRRRRTERGPASTVTNSNAAAVVGAGAAEAGEAARAQSARVGRML